MTKLELANDVNPLTRMRKGESVADLPRPIKKVAKIGNLYHEFVKDTSLQRKGVKGIHVAQELEVAGLITVDYSTNMYAWKGEPMSRQEFLDVYSREQKIKAANAK